MARDAVTAVANVAAATTDAVLVATPAAGQQARQVIVGLVLSAGATGTTVQINSKPAGAGAAVSPVFTLAASQVVVLPHDDGGWFSGLAGAGLSVTTGAGGGVGVAAVVRSG